MGEHPASRAVLDFLREAATAMREGTRATAFVAAVDTSDGDAIRVELEHRDGGPALVLLLRYRRRAFRRSVEYGELTAEEDERHVGAG
jgi:hypothetical protein